MLRAGAASRDITPGLGGDFFGYVRPDIRTRGVALRLQAHALVLDDGQRRVATLTLDLGAPLVTAAILERVADLGYDASNLLIAATHTHAGPSKPGDWAATRAAEALRAADAALRPAVAAWSHAPLVDASVNRSLEAHLANHGLDLYPGTGEPALDPDGDDHPRDTALRMLRVDTAEGVPLAAWAHFSVHPTTFSPANTLLSADFPGAATRHFRGGFAGGNAPVAIFTNGTEGDLIPRYDECNQHACADRIGLRAAAAMRVAWDAAGDRLSGELTVDGDTTRIVYEGQEVEPGKRVARRAWFGLPFIGGAANGPHFLYGLVEGRRRPRVLAGPVHGRKLIAAPAPWPPAADITVLRVGGTLLLGVPGEPSVEAGRRMCAAALGASAAARDADAGAAMSDALIVGLAHSYRGYFTTAEEYEQQHYEGGHTVFGKHTSLLVQHAHTRLAAAIATGPSHPDHSQPGTAADEPPMATTRDGAGRPPVKWLKQPPARIARYETLRWSWAGAPLGADRPADGPYLVLERLDTDGSAHAVDDDLGTGFVWQQRGERVTGYYEVSGGLPVGRYRLDVNGAPTEAFTVVESDGLRVLGVSEQHGRLVFRAQNPPPDPLAALRARDRSPAGGTLRFLVDGQEHVAEWEETAGGWVAVLAAMPTTVRVPEAGLVDSCGNTSGAAVELVVGESRPLRWPPPMGPGGGRVPGPFLLGPTGKPAAWAEHTH